jgi:hypothetical protein
MRSKVFGGSGVYGRNGVVLSFFWEMNCCGHLDFSLFFLSRMFSFAMSALYAWVVLSLHFLNIYVRQSKEP